MVMRFIYLQIMMELTMMIMMMIRMMMMMMMMMMMRMMMRMMMMRRMAMPMVMTMTRMMMMMPLPMKTMNTMMAVRVMYLYLFALRRTQFHPCIPLDAWQRAPQQRNPCCSCKPPVSHLGSCQRPTYRQRAQSRHDPTTNGSRPMFCKC